jgi:predicted lipoprotein
MKRFGWLFFSAASAALLLLHLSCSKGDSAGNGGNNTGGDKDSVLVNIGNNIIIPSYLSLSTSTNALDSAITDFNTDPSAPKLSAVQNLFKTAYMAFESATEFEFGPDDSKKIFGLNLFPVATARIDSNVVSGDINLDAFANKSAKGFPALDYLLFGSDNPTVLTWYTSDVLAANRKDYLAAVSAEIKTTAAAVLNAWIPQGGNYVNTFINSKGTSIGSALGELINSVDQDFELLKNDRLGIPLGKQTLDVLQPQEVEAYYSGISSRLALIQLKAVQSIYLGTGAKGNRHGLSDYVVKANAQYNSGTLDAAIRNEMATAILKLEAVPDPLSSTIGTHTADVNAAYAEAQKLVVLLKTDMPSSLGVLITYADNDGD